MVVTDPVTCWRMSWLSHWRNWRLCSKPKMRYGTRVREGDCFRLTESGLQTHTENYTNMLHVLKWLRLWRLYKKRCPVTCDIFIPHFWWSAPWNYKRDNFEANMISAIAKKLSFKAKMIDNSKPTANTKLMGYKNSLLVSFSHTPFSKCKLPVHYSINVGSNFLSSSYQQHW